MESALQFGFWLVGIVVGVLTIAGATAQVTRAIGKTETAIALLQQELHHVGERMDLLERILAPPPRP
jgi:hypothetical protein